MYWLTYSGPYVNPSHQYGHLQALDRSAGPVVCQPGKLPTENAPTVSGIDSTNDSCAEQAPYHTAWQSHVDSAHIKQGRTCVTTTTNSSDRYVKPAFGELVMSWMLSLGSSFRLTLAVVMFSNNTWIVENIVEV